MTSIRAMTAAILTNKSVEYSEIEGSVRMHRAIVAFLSAIGAEGDARRMLARIGSNPDRRNAGECTVKACANVGSIG